MYVLSRISVLGSSLLWVCLWGIAAVRCEAADVKVVFDIPSKVECRDVTPERCGKAHPNHKVIEARFQISAGFVGGDESTTEDFVYRITSPDLRMKVLDFLPNTTLESTAAGDRIEVTDSTESSDAVSGDAKVAYSLISLGTSKTLLNKKSESNHYERVAPKTLVLSSGTVNRGYGVFYKLRPSAGVSLEGKKEFVLLCIVPKTWRGDWCTVTCSSRAHKKSTVSSKTVQTGIEQAHVGLYLLGDQEASDLADELTHVQLAENGLLSKYLNLEAMHSTDSMNSASSVHLSKWTSNDWIKRVSKTKPSQKETALETVKGKLLEIEERLKDLSGQSDSGR